MPQKPPAPYANSSITTTTSFIVSSDESLNRRPLSSGRSSNSSFGCDIMATTTAAAANDSIQNNHLLHHHRHPSYFVATATAAPTLNTSLAFNQSSESPVSSHSSHSSSSSSAAANCHQRQVNNMHVTPTPATIHQLQQQQQQFNATSPHVGLQQQQQGFGSAPNQLSVNSSNDQYGSSDHQLTDMRRQQQQFLDETPVANSNGSSSSNGLLLSAGSQGQYSPNNYHASFNQQQQQNHSKSTPLVKSSFHHQQHSPSTNSGSNQINQRSSLNSLDSSSSNSLMPINVKGMILNGVASDEVLRAWLISIKQDEYLSNFLDHGYDMHLLTRMTPQDLTAIGCKSPQLRKKLLLEIKKLNLDDDIPSHKPSDLGQWLNQLKLGQYYGQLCRENYDTVEKVCQLTWEDLEEIGIVKLGHQKRLLLGIERLQMLSKQEEEAHRGDNTIYDVHPNHRISLHPGMSSSAEKRMSRSTVRSGFFTTKSGNLDNRGVPVATVMPALKHVCNSMANLDLTQQQTISTNVECQLNGGIQKGGYSIEGDGSRTIQRRSPQPQNPSHEQMTMKMSDFSGTMKRPPPLPPVRTNSLKFSTEQPIDNNIVYDNYGGVHTNGTTTTTTSNYNTMTSAGGSTSTNSTSFLRTPKLGTLTATTNKMLLHGGHIQTISAQQLQPAVMKPVPIREAPHPPQASPMQQPPPPPPPPPPPCNPSSESLQQTAISSAPRDRMPPGPPLMVAPDTLVMDSSLVGHQIAGADEFPPPPPPQ